MSAQPVIPLRPANYPQLYHAARAALFRCEQIDECQEWASKAAAIASYAKQASDSTLEDIAKRIRARAVRRMGELLDKIPIGTGARTDEMRAKTRTGVARAAGLNVSQQVAALQVARVPQEVFEKRVEATPPATLAQLSELGMSKRGGKDAKEQRTTLRIWRFSKWCDKTPASKCQATARTDDVRKILAWCKSFLEIK